MTNWSTRKPKKKKVEAEPEEFPDVSNDFFELLRNLTPNMIPSGWPRYRQGGSARNWGTDGTNDYVPAAGFVQIGTYKDEVDPALEIHEVDIPFAMVFSGTPIVQAQGAEPSNPTGWITWRIIAVYRDYFRISWESDAALTSIKIFWLAFGPGAG